MSSGTSSGAFKEGDTVLIELELFDNKTNVAISDAALVEFTLYGPPSGGVEYLQTRSTQNEGEVENGGSGLYSAKFALGIEGRYVCVIRAVSLAGDEKSEEVVLHAERLRGRI